MITALLKIFHIPRDPPFFSHRCPVTLVTGASIALLTKLHLAAFDQGAGRASAKNVMVDGGC